MKIKILTEFSEKSEELVGVQFSRLVPFSYEIILCNWVINAVSRGTKRS